MTHADDALLRDFHHARHHYAPLLLDHPGWHKNRARREVHDAFARTGLPYHTPARVVAVHAWLERYYQHPDDLT